MNKPNLQTTLQLLTMIGGIAVGAAGIAAYAHTTFASQEQVANGLKGILDKIDTDRCAALLAEMTMLEQRQADSSITPSQRDRLIWVRNQYEAHCTGNT